MEIWHNPRCSKSRAAMGAIDASGVAATTRRYLDDPPSPERLADVLALLGMEPWELVRSGEAAHKELEMRDWGRDASDRGRWIAAMSEHPELIERPIVISGDRAVVGRPVERVVEMLGDA